MAATVPKEQREQVVARLKTERDQQRHLVAKLQEYLDTEERTLEDLERRCEANLKEHQRQTAAEEADGNG